MKSDINSTGMGILGGPYDWCVANKTVYDKQMIVVWHVDDLNISHKNKDTVGAQINHLRKRYGE